MKPLAARAEADDVHVGLARGGANADEPGELREKFVIPSNGSVNRKCAYEFKSEQAIFPRHFIELS